MKKLKESILLFSLLAVFCSARAQELKVKSFQMLERDLIGRTHERLDSNDEPCAVIRVTGPKIKEMRFEGNVVGEVIYSTGEAIVYMPDRARSLTIKSENYGTVKFDFPERVKMKVAYHLAYQIELSEDKKIRTLVMPVVGVGEVMSVGAMIALVRKTGAYLKVKSNFGGLSTDFDCDGSGVIVGESSPSYFSGASKKSRFALTGGVLQRVIRPLYLYAGAGWGNKNVGWELADGKWAKNLDNSYSGVEAELGGIYRLKNIAVMAGVQSCKFKYWEASIGVGIMF